MGAAIFLLPGLAAAQVSTVPARVTQRVDANRLVTLPGNTHPLARAQYDQGAAPADLPMNRMLLILKRSADQEAALQTLLVQQQTKSSPDYHKWLTPDQFGQQFGPADTDIQAVASWLSSSGFQNIKVSRGRTVIEFSGTASQIQSALHTTIHRYLVNGESHWANSTDPSIPAALAPVVGGVVSMHDFHPKPAIVRGDKKLTATFVPGKKPQINLTNSQGQPIHALVPADFNTIYNVTASGETGSGVTIAIASDDHIDAQDVIDFRNMWGLPANFSEANNIIINGPDPGNVQGSGSEGEAVLDATWSGAVAPQATVKLVVSEDTNGAAGVDLSEFYIIDNNLADVMTESFEFCEADAALAFGSLSAAAQFYGAMAEEAAAQGITYAVASGDGGPDACDDPSTLPSPPTVSVNILAATPFNVAVGGTEFHDCDTLPSCDDSAGTYWNSTNGANGGSAKGYIPENVWNEGCTTMGPNCPAADIGIWSSGGGESATFLQPPWQTGTTIPVVAGRLVPDVSMNAADHDGYVLCIDASCQSNPAQFAIASGTSASAQAFGGVMALVVQKTGGRVGNANYVLYKLAANETTYPASCNGSTVPSPATLGGCIFNDVTSGNTNISGATGFPATTGYDKATGLGSVNVGNLVTMWGTAETKASQTALTIGSGPFNYGQAVSVTVTVTATTSGQTTPTGDVSLIANSLSDQGVDSNTLGSTGSVTWQTFGLPGGNYSVHAHYTGDGTFLPSDSNSTTVTVNKAASTTRLGFFAVSDSACSNPLNSSSNSAAYGSQYVLEVAVVDTAVFMNSSRNNGGTICSPLTSGPPPTGTLTLTDGGTPLPAADGGGTFKLNGAGFFEDQLIPNLSVGTHNIQAAYPGDNSFLNSMSNAPMITVTKAPTTATITAPSSVAVNASFQVTVFVDTATTSSGVGSVGANPTGMVTLTLTTSGAAFPLERHGPGPSPFLLGESSVVIALMILLAAVSKKRRGFAWLAAAVILAIAVGTSCGSGGGGGNNTHTTTLGTASVTGSFDAGQFAAATVTFNPVMLSSGGTLNASYSGDSNYNSTNAPGVAISVH